MSEFSRLRARIADWGDAGAVFANSGWLVGENLAKMVVGIAIAAALAQALGPEQLGMLKYAIALVALCSSFKNLGLAGIVVKELAADPEDAPNTLGTTAVLFVLGSAVSFAICVAVALHTLRDDVPQLALALIMAVSVLFHAPRVYVLWYQYRVRSKYAVWATSIPSVLSAVGIIVAVLLSAPVWVFAVVIAGDAVLAGLSLTLVGAIQRDAPRALRVTASKTKSLLGQSWPLIASTMATQIYLKMDQVMLGEMLDERSVGIYAVAADLSEAWYIIPTALGASAMAGIVASYKVDVAAYRERMQDLLDIMVIFAAGIVVLVSLAATPLLNLAFGAEFVDATPVLRVHVLACPFVFMGTVLSKSIITEGYLKFSLARHVLGAVVNIALNLVLIPRMGALGAAWATLASYAVAHYVACAFHPKARVVMRQMTHALMFPIRLLRPSP